MYDIHKSQHRALKKQYCSLPKLYFIAQSAHLQKLKKQNKGKSADNQSIIHCKFRQLRNKKLNFYQLMKELSSRKKSTSNQCRFSTQKVEVRKKYSLQHPNNDVPLRVDNVSFCKRRTKQYDQEIYFQKSKRRRQIAQQNWRKKIEPANFVLPRHYYNKMEYILSNRSIVIDQKQKKLSTQPSLCGSKLQKIVKILPQSYELKKNPKFDDIFSPWEAENLEQQNYNQQI